MLGDVSLTLGQAFGVALTGLSVVFLALISLLIAIVVITKIVGGIQGKEDSAKANQGAQKASPKAAKPVDNSMDPALLAAIVGANSMEAGDVVAPMPGTVLKVNVNNGDTVASGDVILILEAMKMENEIVAPCAGTVTLNVKAGETVDTDAVLASVQ